MFHGLVLLAGREGMIITITLHLSERVVNFLLFVPFLRQAADVRAITALFFGLVLLAATQDIAVDGWALTLLSRRHVGCANSRMHRV